MPSEMLWGQSTLFVIKNKFSPLFVAHIVDTVDEIDEYVYTRNLGDCTHYSDKRSAKLELENLMKSFPELEDAKVVKLRVMYEEICDED